MSERRRARWLRRRCGLSRWQECLFDVAGIAERIEQFAGGVDIEAGDREVLVLGPHRQAERQRQRDGRPVVRIACGDSPFGLCTLAFVVGSRGPVVGMTRSAAKSNAGSRRCFVARRGMCRVISAATASAAMHRGPWGEAMTRRARPPISAARTTLASATTAAGSEIVENLFLARAFGVELSADLLGQAHEHLAANVDR